MAIDIAELRDARRAGIGATDTMASANGIAPWHKADPRILNASGERARVLEGSMYTAEEFLRAAGLDWTVSKQNIIRADGMPLESHQAVIRDSDRATLGVVTKGYRPVQNVEAFRVMDSFVKARYGTWETAGSLWDGKSVYVSIRVQDDAEILPGDRVESYLVLSNSHDGTGAVRATRTDRRVVCNNTLRASLKEGRRVFSVKHTRNAEMSLREAGETFLEVQKRARETRALYRKMAEKRIDHDGLMEFIKDCLQPVRENDAQADSDGVFEMLGGFEATKTRGEKISEARRENTIARIFELASSGKGTEIDGVRGSLWGAYNAVTEYVSHEFPTRGTDLTQSIMVGAAGTMLERAIGAAEARL